MIEYRVSPLSVLELCIGQIVLFWAFWIQNSYYLRCDVFVQKKVEFWYSYVLMIKTDIETEQSKVVSIYFHFPTKLCKIIKFKIPSRIKLPVIPQNISQLSICKWLYQHKSKTKLWILGWKKNTKKTIYEISTKVKWSYDLPKFKPSHRNYFHIKRKTNNKKVPNEKLFSGDWVWIWVSHNYTFLYQTFQAKLQKCKHSKTCSAKGTIYHSKVIIAICNRQVNLVRLGLLLEFL